MSFCLPVSVTYRKIRGPHSKLWPSSGPQLQCQMVAWSRCNVCARH